MTLRQLHDYLDEFDFRVGRMRIIANLPEPDDEDDDPGKVAAMMDLLFGVEAERSSTTPTS